jgi:type VI secretion system secreted protein VgrG
VKRSLRLFVQQAGMKLVAAAGDIDIQALTDNIRLLSKLEISQSANRILITAKEEVVINGGGSYMKFGAGGIEQGTNGDFVGHAARHSFVGPKNRDVDVVMPGLAKLKGKGALNLGTHGSAAGRACAGLPYKLFKDESLVEEGQLDQGGALVFKHDLAAESTYRLELVNGQVFRILPTKESSPDKSSSTMGFHGYVNPGGVLTEHSSNIEEDRLLSNPHISMPDDPSEGDCHGPE